MYTRMPEWGQTRMADGFPGKTMAWIKMSEHDMTAMGAYKATSGRHIRPSGPEERYSTNLFSSISC